MIGSANGSYAITEVALGRGTILPQKKEYQITGDGSATEFSITHILNSQTCIVTVIDNETHQTVNDVMIVQTSTTQIDLTFATAPENEKKYTVAIIS